MIAARRLLSSEPADWALYPVFEDRVQLFCTTYLLTETNVEKLTQELRARWHFSPANTGYWLARTEDGHVVGHVASWVADLWEKKYIFVYQFEMNLTDLQGMRECFRAFLAWVRGTGLDSIEFQTPHDSKLFVRYLEQFGLESVRIRSVIRARVPK